MSDGNGQPDTWTVMRLLQTSARYLGEKGSPSPRLDAELLLAHVLKANRLRLYVDFDKPVTDAERAEYREFIRRRAAGEPVAYLLGEKEFYGRPFKVDRRVLVPRPETELLVDAVRERYEKDGAWLAADFGVGSGALAVTLAGEYPNATVHAVDVDADALSVARDNAERNQLAERIVFHQGSWVEPVEGLTFDFVVSNPPYIAENDPEVASDVREWEPHGALFSGESGLDAIQTLADRLPAVLKPGALWFCEFGARQRPALETLLASAGYAAEFHKDLAGLPRYFIARRLES